MEALFRRMIEMGIVPFDLRQLFYKYRSIKSAAEIITSNQIYFATAAQLNDKLELHTSILDLSFTAETKEKYLKGFFKRNQLPYGSLTDEGFKNMLLSSVDFIKNRVGIFSTSFVSNSSSLWEHYGDNHKGVCLGFKIPENMLGSHLSFKINYTDNPLKIKLVEDNGLLTHDIFYWICTKRSDFAYEKEVRIIDENAFGLKPFNKLIAKF